MPTVGNWLRLVFCGAWDTVLALGMETGTQQASSWTKEEVAERLSYVLVAGGMFTNATDLSLVELEGRVRHTDGDRSDVLSGDVPINRVYLIGKLRDCMLTDNEPWETRNSHFHRDLVPKIMQNRRVFMCEILRPSGGAGSLPIFGIGPNTLDVGDRIMSIPAANKERYRAGYPAWESLPVNTPLRAYNVWSNTFVIRDTGWNPPEGDEAFSTRPSAAAPYPCRPGSKTPIIFRLVGECFLSTVRWLPPSMGLMPREWFEFPSRYEGEAEEKIRFAGNYSYFDKEGEIYMV